MEEKMNFLCLDFINSRWFITHKPYGDPIDDYDWLLQISTNYHLPEMCSLQSNNELKIFREKMFQAFLKLCKKQLLEPSFIDELNHIFKKIQVYEILIPKDENYVLQTQHYSDDLNWVIYQVARSFSKLITEYPLAYLKKCENPECDWIFYDDSKSHNRKWCDNKCASLMKVRRYRAAKKKSL